MNLAIIAAVFPLIFLGELPDKSMFTSLILASRGRPASVWLGAAMAFAVHVAIAVTIGVGLVHILPARVVDALVAVLFFVGAYFAFRDTKEEEEELVERQVATHGRTTGTAFVVIFVAEWGDLTQILTANLAAHYHDPWSVAVGATAALWTVAAIAVTSSRALMRLLPATALRRVTSVVLVILAVITAWSAVRS